MNEKKSQRVLSRKQGLFSRNVSAISRVRSRCSVKKGALKISQISQENTCVGVSFKTLHADCYWQ